ncbi:MAG TPA: helix-turn-helix domain-containing protein [Burkholderiaceae bacterium]|nr:helix-turn-helix domain-containing protein [Burkholderiaceae bacterium]
MSRRPTLTDDEILRRARAVFAEHGYAARTSQLAAAVGLTWPALVFRFGGKTELFRQAMAGSICAAEAADWLGAGAAGLRRPLEQLSAYLLLRWPLHLHRRLATKAFAAREANDVDLDQVGDWLRFTLEVLAARGMVRADLPANTLAKAILSLLVGDVARRFLAGDRSLTPDAGLLDGVIALLAPSGATQGERGETPAASVSAAIGSRAEL